MCAGDNIPQTNCTVGTVPIRTHTSNRPAIRAEGNAANTVFVPSAMDDFGTSVCVIDPNPDATGNRESCPIWGVSEVSRYCTFSKSCGGSIWQAPVDIVLSEGNALKLDGYHQEETYQRMSFSHQIILCLGKPSFSEKLGFLARLEAQLIPFLYICSAFRTCLNNR